MTTKPFPTSLFVALLLAISSIAAAPVGESSDEAKIRHLTARMWQALGQQDLAAFQAICSPNWQLYTASGNKFSAERLFEIHRANLRDFSLQSSEMEIHVRGDFAWVTYDAVMSGLRQDEKWGGDFILTHLFQRDEDGAWKSVHTHESKKP